MLPQEAKRAAGSGASGAAAGTAIMASAAGGGFPGGPVAPATQGHTPPGEQTAPGDAAQLLAKQPADTAAALEQCRAKVQEALRDMEADYLKLRVAHGEAAEALVAFNEFYNPLDKVMKRAVLELGEAHPATKSFRAVEAAVRNMAKHDRDPFSGACHYYDAVQARARVQLACTVALPFSISRWVIVTPEAVAHGTGTSLPAHAA